MFSINEEAFEGSKKYFTRAAMLGGLWEQVRAFLDAYLEFEERLRKEENA